ncbi:hypothetical protein HYT18_00985 [Candidatus Microgenomates bacterium]|nr:hypothetical protein [Candidatus Microgenomates bacterium]
MKNIIGLGALYIVGLLAAPYMQPVNVNIREQLPGVAIGILIMTFFKIPNWYSRFSEFELPDKAINAILDSEEKSFKQKYPHEPFLPKLVENILRIR